VKSELPSHQIRAQICDLHLTNPEKDSTTLNTAFMKVLPDPFTADLIL